MGPCETECPEKILKLLTPTESEWANEWRKRCWENIKKGKTRIKLTEGNQVRSPEPINFTNGKAYQEFVVVDAKRKLFRTLNGSIVQIKGKVDWELVQTISRPAQLELF